MNKYNTLFILGVLTIIIPLTGFPSSWRTAFSILVGIGIIIVGIQIYRIKQTTFKNPLSRMKERAQTFVENIGEEDRREL